MIDSVNSTSNLTNQITSSQISSNQTTSENFTDYLTNETSLKIDTSKKPNIKELMDFTNMSFKEASSILYGVIGSNEDTRDWNKILTSSDVLKTAKEETAKMYNSDSQFSLVNNSEETTSTDTQTNQEEINPVTTLVDVQEGNIKFIQSSKYDEQTQSDVVTNSLYLASSNGNLLRNAGNTPAQILENLDAFGFSVEPLKTLANNSSIPTDTKNLLNETIAYINNMYSNANSTLTSTQSYSTLDFLTNNLNKVDNSHNE